MCMCFPGGNIAPEEEARGGSVMLWEILCLDTLVPGIRVDVDMHILLKHCCRPSIAKTVQKLFENHDKDLTRY